MGSRARGVLRQGDWAGSLTPNNMLVVDRGSPTYLGRVNRYKRGSFAPTSERSRPVDLEDTIVFDGLGLAGDIEGLGSDIGLYEENLQGFDIGKAVKSANPLASMFDAPKMIGIGLAVGVVLGLVIGYKVGKGGSSE